MRGYVALLLLLAAIWGASFMFIKIAVDELAPTTTMALRLVFSAFPLLGIVFVKRGFRPASAEMRTIVVPAMVLGVFSTALPFTLIAWGETRIDSGVAAIGNASMPIFVALLAFRFRKTERATGARLLGVVLGLIGVAVLAGVDPRGGWAGFVGTLAVVPASDRRDPSALALAGLGRDRRSARTWAARHRRRPAHLLPDDLRLRLGAGEPRRLPAPGYGAPLWSGAARRDGHDVGDRRARPDSDRDRTRIGVAPALAARAGAGLAVSEVILGDGFRLRRATLEDVDFLAALARHDDVQPFLSVRRARDPEAVRAEVERSLADPEETGRFLIEVEENGEWRRAGSMGFDLANKRNRIANLGGLAVHPDYRGRKLSDDAARLFQRHLLVELDFHRLQLEIYGFNERAIQHAERSGFVREGVKRKAYWRHGDWADGVQFGLLREDLEE
ncbi:MAG: GNAT family N-acetyltransferase [Actinobacteria bacterium]|nr:MAG: GNAT family N-acetyltransferase [Actinomycetota bacterium]